MKILDNEKDIDTCTSRFREIIEDQYHVNSLAEKLDSIHFKYSQYVLNDQELGSNRLIESNELLLLKQLRDIFIKFDKP